MKLTTKYNVSEVRQPIFAVGVCHKWGSRSGRLSRFFTKFRGPQVLRDRRHGTGDKIACVTQKRYKPEAWAREYVTEFMKLVAHSPLRVYAR